MTVTLCHQKRCEICQLQHYCISKSFANILVENTELLGIQLEDITAFTCIKLLN